jgi:hypothetical protein
MIGKPLSERYGVQLRPLGSDEAVAIVRERLDADGAALVQVRARDPLLVACLFVRAGAAEVRLCRELGLELALGGSGVVGLLGVDAARLFAKLAPERRAWLERRSEARETRVLLFAGGVGMVSVLAETGKVEIRAVE